MAQEADTQKAILDYLSYKNIFHWRQNSGGMAIPGPQRRFIRMGITGAPDIFVVKKGQIIGLEVKSKIGKQNDNQIDFEKRFVAAGGVYHVVRCIDDVINAGL